MKVQIGSTMVRSGRKMRMMDDISTPTDAKRSPNTCRLAALKLILDSYGGIGQYVLCQWYAIPQRKN